MKDNILGTVNKVVAEICRGIDLSISKPFYIPIKDNRIHVSSDIDSIIGADECMLFIPSFWDFKESGESSVSKKYFYKLAYIDKNRKFSFGLTKDKLMIDWTQLGDRTTKIRLVWNYNNVLYESKNTFPLATDFYELWECYQAVLKIVEITEKEYKEEKKQLLSKINELKEDYDKLKEEYKIE